MTQSGQVRDACDRCHSIKTRCQRVASDRPVCQRCDRLGLPCSYSPPGQTGRPPGGRKRKEPDASTAEDPDRPPQQSSKKPERLGQQGNTINVATGSTIAALLSPGENHQRYLSRAVGAGILPPIYALRATSITECHDQ